MASLSWEDVIASIPDAKCEKLLATQATESEAEIVAAIAAFRAAGFTLVTGAGLSLSSGVPAWSELLARLRTDALNSTLSKKGAKILGELIGRIAFTDSPIVAARQITAAVPERELPQRVRAVLYENVTQSELMKEVARLCVPNANIAGIVAVLTYNFDLLLEDELTSIGRVPRTLYRSVALGPEGLAVRHVHGFLPKHAHADEAIVLTESQYHDEYARPYSWSNVVQLNTFRESSCLFVGSSMSDPNQRRLLEIARREHAREHFAILRRTRPSDVRDAASASWATRGPKLGKPSHAQHAKVDARVKLASYMLDQTRAHGLEQLGVRVIWVDEHDEVPGVLKRVRGAA